MRQCRRAEASRVDPVSRDRQLPPLRPKTIESFADKPAQHFTDASERDETLTRKAEPNMEWSTTGEATRRATFRLSSVGVRESPIADAP
jgi:hypothetical protein